MTNQHGRPLMTALASYDRALWARSTPTDALRRMSWQATFYTTGMEHSPTSPTGSGWGSHATYRHFALPRWSRGRAKWRSYVTALDRSRLPSSRRL
jgi:hypothetical protein